jgi:hypothetical protein
MVKWLNRRIVLTREWKVLFDAIHVRFVSDDCATEAATALGVLALQQVTLAGARAQDFAGASDFEPLGHGLLGFNSLRATHNDSAFSQKERAI